MSRISEYVRSISRVRESLRLSAILVAPLALSTTIAIAQTPNHTNAYPYDERCASYLGGSCNLCPPGEAPAYVYQRGPEYDNLSNVCLNNLGIFDKETGVKTRSNFDPVSRRYLLDGRFLQTNVQTLAPTISRFSQALNDFRILPQGARNLPWSSEAHLYFFINKYRSNFVNDAFITNLGMGATPTLNLRHRQFHRNLVGLVNARLPFTYARELTAFAPISSSIPENNLFFPLKQGPVYNNQPDSLALDPEVVIAEYTGLAANWISAGTAPWPTNATFGQVSSDNGSTTWKVDVRPAILEGFKLWNAYRFSGRTELQRYGSRVMNRWSGAACGTINTAPCNKGRSIENVMMYSDEALPFTNNPTNPAFASNTSMQDDQLLFPFMSSLTVSGNRTAAMNASTGPKNAALAGMFIGAIFYDISKEVGLGDYKTDLLFWKTMSLIDPALPLNMTQFGAKVQQAARALFPTTANSNLSWYEQDLVEVFASRGVRMNGTSDFRSNLPSPIGISGNMGPGTLLTPSGNGFGSAVPEGQRNSATGYNFLGWFNNQYTVSGAQYVTYQFYKHSKYGPCDALEVTNGTVSGVGSSDIHPTMDYNGTMNARFEGRAIGNMLLSVPGTTTRFIRKRQSCVTESDGNYAEDVRPFGFRVVKAIPNGFTFRVTRIGGLANGRIRYQINIVDPSLTMSGPNTGPATYNLRVTEFNGVQVNATGQQVTYDALADQPFTLYIERIRGAANDNITVRERGNDFDRLGGAQLNQDYVSVGYKVGFDTLLNRRNIETSGSYISALNTSGGAFGVQAHRWSTPPQIVQPLRFSTVSHGVGVGGNSYRFQDASYYNACIWSLRNGAGSVTEAPGCLNVPASGIYEQRAQFSGVGLDLARPFGAVNATSVPAYLWTVNYPTTWRLAASREYWFGSHVAADTNTNGASFNVCARVSAPGAAGTADDRSDWLAGSSWNGVTPNPPPQTMKAFLASGHPNAIAGCSYAAYRFEGQTVAN
jgi:hypothetical protein